MKKTIQGIICILAITGVLINIMVHSFEEPINLFKGLWLLRYFTLQSNVIVALFFGYLLMNKKSIHIDKYIGGVTVYISITFIIYAVMLSGTWNPTGWNQVANVLSHYLVPILVMIYFFTINDITSFTYKDIFTWMYYPIGYVVFMVVHGVITDDYLYPFFQVSNVGVFGLIITLILLVFFFVFLSFIFMKIVSLTEKYKHN